MPNNVNQDELAKFVDAVKKNPADAKKEKMVEVSWNFQEGTPQASSDLAYAKGSRHVESELPAFAGGWGTAPDPIQYCLFGLASCFAVTLAATATAEGIPLTELKVKAQNRLDLHKQLGLSTDPIIHDVRFTVVAKSPKGPNAIKRLVKLAEERCPGTECLTRSIPFRIDVA